MQAPACPASIVEPIVTAITAIATATIAAVGAYFLAKVRHGQVALKQQNEQIQTAVTAAASGAVPIDATVTELRQQMREVVDALRARAEHPERVAERDASSEAIASLNRRLDSLHKRLDTLARTGTLPHGRQRDR